MFYICPLTLQTIMKVAAAIEVAAGSGCALAE
jgi:hypothetical protein